MHLAYRMSSFRKFYCPPTAERGLECGLSIIQCEEGVHGAYKKMVDPNYIDQEGRGNLHLALLHQPEEPDLVYHVIRWVSGIRPGYRDQVSLICCIMVHVLGIWSSASCYQVSLGRRCIHIMLSGKSGQMYDVIRWARGTRSVVSCYQVSLILCSMVPEESD